MPPLQPRELYPWCLRKNFGYLVKSGGEGALYAQTLFKSLANCSGGNREAHEDVLWVITRTAGNSITKSAPKREVVSHRTCERKTFKYTHNFFPTSLKAHARLHQLRRKKERIQVLILHDSTNITCFWILFKYNIEFVLHLSLYTHTHTMTIQWFTTWCWWPQL